MLTLEVEIDGEKFVVAGSEDWGLLSVIVNASRGASDAPNPRARSDTVEVRVGGLTDRDTNGHAYHLRWGTRDLKVGSRVSIKVIEAEQPDPPIKRYRSDVEVQESPFTEEKLRELRWKDYLDLKKEFEGK